MEYTPAILEMAQPQHVDIVMSYFFDGENFANAKNVCKTSNRNAQIIAAIADEFAQNATPEFKKALSDLAIAMEHIEAGVLSNNFANEAEETATVPKKNIKKS